MTIPIEDQEVSTDEVRPGEDEASRPMLFERSELVLQDTLEQHPNKARKITQILAVVAVSVGAFIHGTTVSFPAVSIPSICKSNATNNNTTINNNNINNNGSFTNNDAKTSSDIDDILGGMPFFVTDDDISLIVSIASAGMLFGSLIAGPFANLIGRKYASIFGTCGTLALGYSLFAGAQFPWMMLLGRFLHGVGLGFSTTISTIYIMEVATPNMRGSLAVIPAVAGTLGLLTTQVLGAYLNWQWLSIVCAGLNVPFLLMLIFIPESPVYLISTEQIERAHKILRVLRGPKWDVTKELTDIKVASEGRQKYRVTCKDFGDITVLKPFLIALTLMFFFQCTGINIILQFTVDIFQSADSTVQVFQATILVGIALLSSNLITLAVAYKMPRRLMLILSSLGISAALIGMGCYFLFKDWEKWDCQKLNNHTEIEVSIPTSKHCHNYNNNSDFLMENCPPTYTESIGWLPLLILMVYIFFFNLGYGAMIWITVVEILPLHVRSVATSLSVGFTCVCSYLTSHTYANLKDFIGLKGTFWLYGNISAVGLLFIFFFVPETKGKTEAEIREFFLNSKKKVFQKNNPKVPNAKIN